jgi:uncharacterized protein YndB with AHSA1/START domain
MKSTDLKLSYDLYIAAPAERVWDAITDGAVTEQYFYGTRVKSSFRRGAEIAYAAGDAKMIEGEVVAVEKGHKRVLSQRALWDDGVAADPASQVTWELSSVGSATKVSLMHEGFRGETETFKQSAAGWPVILSGMKTLLETGRPLVLPPPP